MLGRIREAVQELPPLPGDPYEDNGDMDLGPRPPTVTQPPTVDTDPSELPTVPISYPDWDASRTYIRSGPLGFESKFKGDRFPTVVAAKQALIERHGRLFEFYTLPGRWFARVAIPEGK